MASAPSMTEGHHKTFHKVKNFTPGIVAGDILAAAATASVSSCFISVIDKSIMEKTLGKRPSIMEGLVDGWRTLFTKPHLFFLHQRPVPNFYREVYGLVFMVYCNTYICGNIAQSYCEAYGVDYKLPKFTAGSIVNVGITLYKDNEMLKILPPTGGAPKPVPNISRLLFVTRDVLTVMSSFYLAPVVAQHLRAWYPSLSERQASDIADVTVPAAVQLISTPLHLYGIARKEHPQQSPSQLLQLVRRDYGPACLARMSRIVPAFGFGMMINKRLRSYCGEQVEG